MLQRQIGTQGDWTEVFSLQLPNQLLPRPTWNSTHLNLVSTSFQLGLVAKQAVEIQQWSLFASLRQGLHSRLFYHPPVGINSVIFWPFEIASTASLWHPLKSWRWNITLKIQWRIQGTASPLIFRPNWGQRAEKIFFETTSAPCCQSVEIDYHEQLLELCIHDGGSLWCP